MKFNLNKYSITYQSKIITALILTGLLSVIGSLTIIQSSTAGSTNFTPKRTNAVLATNPQNRLPRTVANAVLRDLATKEKTSTKELKIIDYRQQTWNNGCLELAQPNEFCTQALVPGWQVVVSNNRQKWIYHTNPNGRSLRLASTDNQPGNLPESVKNAVLSAASQRLQLPTSELTIIQAQAQTWSDGCFNLGGANELCLQALVEGWRVTVGAGDKTLVYHTNQNSLVKFNPAASQVAGNTGNLNPVAIPDAELPPPLDQGMVFREISSGGLLGRTYETVLLNDGRLMRVRIGDANDSERSVWSISPQQVRQFQQLLKLSKFRNLSYPAPAGAADYITYTLTSRYGTVQYNDISQSNLPHNLRRVVKTWNRIVNSAQR